MIVKEEFEVTVTEVPLGPTDFEVFARDKGYWLTDDQIEFGSRLIRGMKTRGIISKQSAKVVHDLLTEYLAQRNYIGHFKNTHFIAMTAAKEKFVYCPVGNICSWNPEDFNHRYCAYCKKFFPKGKK